MLGAHVQNCFVLIVPQIEILTSAVKVLFKHGHIVVLEGVVEGQVTVVVDDIGSRPDLIDNGVLLVDADDVLDRLTLVVLLSSRDEESIVSAEPLIDSFVTVSCAFEKRIFSQIVVKFAIEGIVLVL